MSTVNVSAGSASSSSQRPGHGLVDGAVDGKHQSSMSTRGVGPAESTGKSLVWYWPGRDARRVGVAAAAVEAAGDRGHPGIIPQMASVTLSTVRLPDCCAASRPRAEQAGARMTNMKWTLARSRPRSTRCCSGTAHDEVVPLLGERRAMLFAMRSRRERLPVSAPRSSAGSCRYRGEDPRARARRPRCARGRAGPALRATRTPWRTTRHPVAAGTLRRGGDRPARLVRGDHGRHQRGNNAPSAPARRYLQPYRATVS